MLGNIENALYAIIDIFFFCVSIAIKGETNSEHTRWMNIIRKLGLIVC